MYKIQACKYLWSLSFSSLRSPVIFKSCSLVTTAGSMDLKVTIPVCFVIPLTEFTCYFYIMLSSHTCQQYGLKWPHQYVLSFRSLCSPVTFTSCNLVTPASNMDFSSLCSPVAFIPCCLVTPARNTDFSDHTSTFGHSTHYVHLLLLYHAVLSHLPAIWI